MPGYGCLHAAGHDGVRLRRPVAGALSVGCASRVVGKAEVTRFEADDHKSLGFFQFLSDSCDRSSARGERLHFKRGSAIKRIARNWITPQVSRNLTSFHRETRPRADLRGHFGADSCLWKFCGICGKPVFMSANRLVHAQKSERKVDCAAFRALREESRRENALQTVHTHISVRP